MSYDISLEKYKSTALLHLNKGTTFLFNGSTPKTKKYTKHVTKNKIKSSGKVVNSKGTTQPMLTVEPMTSTAPSYYQFLAATYSTYMDTEVEGPPSLVAGQSDDHSLRSTTHTGAVDNYWSQQGYNVVHDTYSIADYTHVDQHWVNVSTTQAAVFNTINPMSNSTTSFSIPFYFGDTIGVQWFPVTTSSTTISNAGSSDISYHFNEANVDDTNIDTQEPVSDGFGVKYEVDTTTYTSNPLIIDADSKFEYKTPCANYSSSGNFGYIFYNYFTADNSVYYDITVN